MPKLLALIAALPLLALSAAAHAQVYRCGNSYSDTPCPHGQSVDVSSSSAVGAERQRYRTERERSRERAAITRELDKAQQAPGPQRDAADRQSRCQALQRRIDKIDQMARTGGSARKMEQLREERQAARDQQFRLGC